MRLILVRHSETKEFKDGIIQGWLDVPLTKQGIKLAKMTALRFKDEKIDAIFSSDSQRCQSTAKEIIKYHPKVKLHLTNTLREQHKTIFEGKPKDFWREAINKSNQSWYLFKPPGGESMLEVQKRVVTFYHNLIKNYLHQTVLLVTSGGPIVSLILYLRQESFSHYRSFQPDFTAVSEILVNKQGKALIQVLNSRSHIQNNSLQNI